MGTHGGAPPAQAKPRIALLSRIIQRSYGYPSQGPMRALWPPIPAQNMGAGSTVLLGMVGQICLFNFWFGSGLV
jgi:hypothetical protein